jgi:hypothetical protein
MPQKGAHHRSLKSRIKRAGLESQFGALYQGYLKTGLTHDQAIKESTSQIRPAVLHWETTNRDVVNAKKLIRIKRDRAMQKRRQELEAAIKAKQAENEDYLTEAKELAELSNPALKPKFRHKGTQDPWETLALDMPSDKRADFRSIVDWVFNNIQTPVEALSPLDCPCRGAVTMLRAVREDPTMYSEFMRSHWAKLIPSKAEIEAEARFRDDNANVVKMMDAFEKELNRKHGRVLEKQISVDITGKAVADPVGIGHHPAYDDVEPDADEATPEESEKVAGDPSDDLVEGA